MLYYLRFWPLLACEAFKEVCGAECEDCGMKLQVMLPKEMEAATLTFRVSFDSGYDWASGGKLPGLSSEGFVPCVLVFSILFEITICFCGLLLLFSHCMLSECVHLYTERCEPETRLIGVRDVFVRIWGVWHACSYDVRRSLSVLRISEGL